MKTMQILIMLTIVLLIGSKCQSTKQNAKEEVDEKEIVDEEKENHDEEILFTYDTIYVNRIDTFQIDLEADFSLGKIWKITAQDDALNLINKSESKISKNSSRFTLQHFFFTSNENGQYNLIFEYARPFGKNVGEKKIANQLIIVQEN